MCGVEVKAEFETNLTFSNLVKNPFDISEFDYEEHSSVLLKKLKFSKTSAFGIK